MALTVATPARVTPTRRAGGGGLGLTAWLAVVAVALGWGSMAVRTADVGLHAAPLKGHWAWHGGWALLPAAGLGLAVVAGGPRIAAWLAWRWVPLSAGAVAALWTVALAAGDGWSRLTAPLTTRHEYEPFAAGVHDLGGFLSTYVDRLDRYPIHVQGHPPGPVVLAWALDRIGLSGAGWLAAVVVMGWGLAVGAALVAARRVGGEAAARRAAPALAILPAAIWAGTSVDALFAGLVAVGLALAVAAAARPAGAGPTAVAAGVVSGTALLCTYGAVPPVLVGGTLVVVLAGRRAPHLSALIGGGAVLPLLLAAGAGFWWPAGLAATRAAYWSGIGAERPGGYLTFAGNPGALALAVGPAVAVGLATLARPAVDHVAAAATARRGGHRVGSAGSAGPATRPATVAGTGVDVGPAQGSPRDWLLPVAALVAVALADLSQLARGEVERIWLPFVPWLALAAPGDRRGWLGAQVGLALLLQSFLASPW